MMHGKGDGTSRLAAQKELPALNGLSYHPPSLFHYTSALVGLPLSRLNWCVMCRDLVEQI